MKAVIEKQIVLTLSQEEARWLNLVMQNPLNGQTPEDESRHDRQMREAFHMSTVGL